MREKYDYTPIKNFIDELSSLGYLDSLETLYFEYAELKLSDPNKIIDTDANSLFALRSVIEAFKMILKTAQK